MRYVTLQAQPDQRLDHLVDAEKNWQRGEGDDALAPSRAADSIDADRGNDDTSDEVSLRRKTHLMRGYKEFVRPDREVRLR